MLEVLLESRGVRAPRPMVEAVFSTLAHGALLALAVAGPSLGNHYVSGGHVEETTPAEYLVPPDRSGSRQEQHLTFFAVGTAGSSHAAGTAVTTPDDSPSGALSENQAAMAPPRAELVDDAYSVLDVDSAAVRDPSSVAPAYPPAMMRQAIEGAATMKFVIDSTGRVDLGTVQTVTATNLAFAQAVLVALPRMRFHPARIGAVPVRQVSSQEFKFQILNLGSTSRP